jgi:hypothetical protein
VELAIRTAMLKLGGRLLEDLLGLDAGHRGPRMGCGRWDEIWQRPCSQTVPADPAILAS